MKKYLFVFILLIAGMSVASAQVNSNMRYKDLKYKYSTKGYVRSTNDPYSPGWNAVASYVVPGLGQLIEGETGRGVRFFAASTVCSAIGHYQADRLRDNLVKDANGKYMKDASGNYMLKDEAAAKRQVMYMCAAGLSEFIVCLWSCVDAAKVAKVKNLYSRDLNKITLEPSLYPAVQTVQTSNGCQFAPGMTLALKF